LKLENLLPLQLSNVGLILNLPVHQYTTHRPSSPIHLCRDSQHLSFSTPAFYKMLVLLLSHFAVHT